MLYGGTSLLRWVFIMICICISVFFLFVLFSFYLFCKYDLQTVAWIDLKIKYQNTFHTKKSTKQLTQLTLEFRDAASPWATEETVKWKRMRRLPTCGFFFASNFCICMHVNCILNIMSKWIRVMEGG